MGRLRCSARGTDESHVCSRVTGLGAPLTWLLRCSARGTDESHVCSRVTGSGAL